MYQLAVAAIAAGFALSSWAYEPPLCKEDSSSYEVCQTYRHCIMFGQLMGPYEDEYLISACIERTRSEFDLSQEEFDEAMKDAAIDQN
ncbi:MAG: hypothetical protein AAF202_00785 [Pseudomonadota bacterium]